MSTCFINAAIGTGWYGRGSVRLRHSLQQHGYTGEYSFWRNEWPSNKFPRDCVYNIKADAFDAAIKVGHTTIIWGDCSIYAVRDVNPFIERINRDGYWIGQSGYNAAQTCSDACLAYFGVDRDWAEKTHDCATGIFGVNMDFEKPRQFIERWIQAGKDGTFRGARVHGRQSKDPRYLHHRQDQAAASVVLGQLGMPLGSFQEFVAFRWDNGEKVTFRCEGM